MKFIKLPFNRFTIVDNQDFDQLKNFKWSYKDGYAGRIIHNRCGGHCSAHKCKTVYIHKIVAGFRPGLIVDHINRNSLDNRRCNLRLIPPHQNQWNRKLNCNSKSGVTGVSLNGRGSGEHTYRHLESGKNLDSLMIRGMRFLLVSVLRKKILSMDKYFV